MPDFMSKALGPPWQTLGMSRLRAFTSAVMLVALATLIVGILFWLFNSERIVGVFLVPVLISAIRWGLWPGLLAAVTSVVVISILFAKPTMPLFLELDWEQMVRLGVFCLVAIVASRLAQTLKLHA